MEHLLQKYGWHLINSIMIVILLAIALFYLDSKKIDEEIVYINNSKVFNEFKMTKDLFKVNQGILSREKNKVDSLLIEARNLEKRINSKRVASNKEKDNFNSLQGLIIKRDNELKQREIATSQEVTSKVWKRLNEYVKAFGEEKGVKLILGTQGRGNIMYAYRTIDFTDEFLEYANLKYEDE